MERQTCFGNPDSNKTKIFIVGDSFTQGTNINENLLYYQSLKNLNNTELFVYAAGGYGTLQEYLVINQYFDLIKPDLIILQVCNNDFINNSFELESRSYYNNNHQLRPYLIENQIKYQDPNLFLKENRLLSKSRLIIFLRERIYEIMAFLANTRVLVSIEEVIAKQGLENNLYQQSIATTDSLIKMIKKRIGATKIVAFTVDETYPYTDSFQSIFRNNNIPFIQSIPEKIKKYENQGLNLRLPDQSHWNEKGHKIAGKILHEELNNTLNLK